MLLRQRIMYTHVANARKAVIVQKLSDADIRNLRCLGWQIKSQHLKAQGSTPDLGACQKQGKLGQNPGQLLTPTSQMVANNGLTAGVAQTPAQASIIGNSAKMAPLPGLPGSAAQGPVNNYGPLSTGPGPVALDGNHSRGLPKQMGALG